MPKQSEVATVSLAGKNYSTWESVRVDLDYMDMATRSFQVSIVEKEDGNGGRLNTEAVWSALRIKPGDKCTVSLAGIQVINGYVEQRQTAFDANHHGVLVAGRSKTNDYVDSTVDRKNAHFKNKSFKEIAEKVLDPFKLTLKVENPPKDFDKKFKDVSSNPGETAHSFIERLARARGAFVRDDKEGNVVVGTVDGKSTGKITLREGQNIKSLNCLIRDDTIFSKIAAVGQQRGDDQVNGEDSRKPAGKVDGSSDRYRPKDVLVEEPGDAQDLKRRVEHERNIMLGNTIEVVVVVQGWKKNASELWDVGETIPVYAPSALLDHDLSVKTISFGQDDSGSITTLTLVRPDTLGFIAKPGITSNPKASVLPGGEAKEGTAEP